MQIDSGQISSLGRESGNQQSEVSMLMEDILSLERERKDLLGSLTPSISYWREKASPTATGWMIAGKGTVAVNRSSVQGSSIIKPASSIQSGSQQVYLPHAVRDVDKELWNYFDFFLQDMEHLGHRMLSTKHFLWSSRATISSCQADELIRTASKLMKNCKDIYDAGVEKSKDEEKRQRQKQKQKEKKQRKKQRQKHKKVEEDASEKRERKKEEVEEDAAEKMERKEGEQEKMEFFRLSSNVRDKPNHYENELAMVFTEDDEEEYEREREAEREAEMERKQRKHKKQQQFVVEQGADQNKTKTLEERMETELRLFSNHRNYWEDTNSSKTGQCGRFQDKTTLSPMQFTHYIPGIILPPAAVIGTTVQIYSFKITQLHNDLKWPIYVYGVVAARDTVDRNRNLLFRRSSVRCQELTENDSSLCLTGPSRAILAEDPVDFEVELKINEGGDEINDRVLISVSKPYDGAEQPLSFHGSLCSAELSLGRLATTVQATIVGIRVGKGMWPFKCGGRVTCSLYSAAVGDLSCGEVVLLDSAEKIPEDGLDGYISLSRNVVSVQLKGLLKVGIQAYGGSDPPVYIDFHPQDCNVSMGRCFINDIKVDIKVAWSRLVRDKMDLLIEGYSTQP